MLGVVEVRYKGAIPQLRRSDFNTIKRQTFQRIGIHWHEEIRPKHFTNAGAGEYDYTPRAGERGRSRRSFRSSYTGRKLRYFGHTRPLEYTGEGRKLSQIQDVRVTSQRVRIILPNKFNFRNPTSPIIMREELTAISQRDEDELTELADKDIGERLNRLQTTTTTRIS